MGVEANYFRKRAVRLTALLLGVALAVLFSIALVTSFDTVKCLFEYGSIIGEIAFYCAVFAPIAVALLVFTAVPKEKPCEPVFPEENRYLHYYTAENTFVRLIRAFVCFVIAVQGAVRIVFLVLGVEKGGLPTFVAAMMLVAVFPFCAYFVPEITEKLGKADGRFHLMLGTFGIAFPLLSVIDLYFSKTYPISSEYVTVCQLCFISVMLATVYEIRYRLDGIGVRARLATTSAAFVLCFGFNFGRIVMLVGNGAVSPTDVSTTATLFVLSLYYGVRIFFYDED